MIMEDSGIDSDPKQLLDERLNVVHGHSINDSQASDSSSSNSSITSPLKTKSKHLERRADRTKKTQRNHKRSSASGLIPIQRLPIPGPASRHPLVDWDTDDSEEDINFFPVSRTRETRQELTDTFSIENLPLSAGEDDEDDEEDLDLLPPKPVRRPWSCCQCSVM